MARYYRLRGFVVAAEDEATFGLIPILSRGWAQRGSRPVARMNFKHKYVKVMGARSKRSFVFTFGKRNNKLRFVKFMALLRRCWNKVFLLVDHAKYHDGKEIQEFLQCNRKTFRILYFPHRTPELNPVEQCWKPGRQVLSNRLLRTLPAAKYHLRKTFNNRSLLPKMFQFLSN